MKQILLILALMFSACGGGSYQPVTPTSQAPLQLMHAQVKEIKAFDSVLCNVVVICKNNTEVSLLMACNSVHVWERIKLHTYEDKGPSRTDTPVATTPPQK